MEAPTTDAEHPGENTAAPETKPTVVFICKGHAMILTPLRPRGRTTKTMRRMMTTGIPSAATPRKKRTSTRCTRPARSASVVLPMALTGCLQNGDLEALNKALTPKEDGPSVSLDEKDGIWECAPLHVALLYRRLDCVKALLAAGASVNKCCEGMFPIHLAVSLGGFDAHREFSKHAVGALLQHTKQVSAPPALCRCCCSACHVASALTQFPVGRFSRRSTTVAAQHCMSRPTWGRWTSRPPSSRQRRQRSPRRGAKARPLPKQCWR